jgi:hypothetical protein
MGLGQEERAELPSLGVEPIGAVPQADENILDDLLGQLPSPQNPEGEGEQSPAMAPVQLGEGIVLVSMESENETGIAHTSERRPIVAAMGHDPKD